MEVPEEFIHFALCFMDYGERKGAAPHEWIPNALRLAGKRREVVVKKFLSELLTGRYDDKKLRQVWDATGASFRFHDAKELRKFLIMVRKAIKA